MKKRIRWYDHLYMGPSVRGLEKTMRYEMKFRKAPLGYYFITLPENPADLLDIWSSEQLRMPWMRDRVIDIIGAAGSGEEARMLAAAIVCEVYEHTGAFDMRSYLGYH